MVNGTGADTHTHPDVRIISILRNQVEGRRMHGLKTVNDPGSLVFLQHQTFSLVARFVSWLHHVCICIMWVSYINLSDAGG